MESNSSGLTVYSFTSIQPPAVNCLLIKLNSNILNSEFDNNILDTLVPNLVPNFNKLELLGCEI